MDRYAGLFFRGSANSDYIQICGDGYFYRGSFRGAKRHPIKKDRHHDWNPKRMGWTEATLDGIFSGEYHL